MGKKLSLLLVTILFTACSNPGNSPSVQAPVNVADSFKVSKSVGVDSQMRLTIARTSLEKEFMLQGELIPQTSAAMGNSLKSRIVAFRLRGNSLYLLEASAGHVVTTDLPSNLLLASFPVLASDDQSITFDFSAGMSTLYTLNDMAASDDGGSDYDGNSQFKGAKILRSFIQDAAVDSSNRLLIRQIAQMDVSSDISPVEIRYYLSPYLPSPDYTGIKWQSNYDHFGFFQTNPELTPDSDSVIFSTRWNAAHPITYAVSANTPAEFKQAVREGILYWNRVAGREIIKVIDAPAGVTAPNMDYNVVQWVPYDTAGFAYADMQSDPRTGEIQHAQVFFTSAFTFIGKIQARQMLRKFASPQPPVPVASLQVNGFVKSSLCNFDASKELATSLQTFLATNPDDATVLKAAQDYVRLVAAHEVGHTLGLRHNFAGSLAGNYSMSQRDNLVEQYYSNKKTTPGTVVTSSVMDYLMPEESFMGGDLLKTSVFPYDQKAIAVLYSGAPSTATQDWPLFCTDSTQGKFVDCRAFDVGHSEIEFLSYSAQKSLKMLPQNLIEAYITAKVPVLSTPATPVAQVALPDPKAAAAKVLGWRSTLLKQLTQDGAVLSVQRSYPFVGSFNMDVVNNAQLEYLKSEVARLGGWQAIFAPIDESYATTALAQIDQLLRGSYRQGIGAQDQAYNFSDSEIATIEANAEIFLKSFVSEYHKAEMEILVAKKLDKKFLVSDISDSLEQYLNTRANETILAQSGAVIEADIQLPKQTATTHVKLPVFTHKYNARLNSAGLLRNGRSDDSFWGVQDRAILKAKLDAIIKTALGADPGTFDITQIPASVARWIDENQDVSKAL